MQDLPKSSSQAIIAQNPVQKKVFIYSFIYYYLYGGRLWERVRERQVEPPLFEDDFGGFSIFGEVWLVTVFLDIYA